MPHRKRLLFELRGFAEAAANEVDRLKLHLYSDEPDEPGSVPEAQRSLDRMADLCGELDARLRDLAKLEAQAKKET